MVEKKIGGLSVSVGSNGKRNKRGWVIGTFAWTGAGKTRFALTGPAPVGFVPLETKAFPTIEKDGNQAGIEVFYPSDEQALLINPRKVAAMVDDPKGKSRVIQQQEYYLKHIQLIESYVYGLLEDPAIKLVCVDKFNTYCNWVKFGINGMEEKYMKVQGKVYKDNTEPNQHIIDFLNSIGQYGKPVILNNAVKPDYDGPKDAQGNPVRNTWDGFKYLGSHCNLVVELIDNKSWDPEKNGEKYDWKYKLNVNRSQDRPELEGPEGQGILKDEGITIPRLMKRILGGAYVPEEWMSE